MQLDWIVPVGRSAPIGVKLSADSYTRIANLALTMNSSRNSVIRALVELGLDAADQIEAEKSRPGKDG